MFNRIYYKIVQHSYQNKKNLKKQQITLYAARNVYLRFIQKVEKEYNIYIFEIYFNTKIVLKLWFYDLFLEEFL